MSILFKLFYLISLCLTMIFRYSLDSAFVDLLKCLSSSSKAVLEKLSTAPVIVAE